MVCDLSQELDFENKPPLPPSRLESADRIENKNNKVKLSKSNIILSDIEVSEEEVEISFGSTDVFSLMKKKPVVSAPIRKKDFKDVEAIKYVMFRLLYLCKFISNKNFSSNRHHVQLLHQVHLDLIVPNFLQRR